MPALFTMLPLAPLSRSVPPKIWVTPGFISVAVRFSSPAPTLYRPAPPRSVPLSVTLLPFVSKPNLPTSPMKSWVSVIGASKRRNPPPKTTRPFVPSAAGLSIASAPPLMMVAPLWVLAPVSFSTPLPAFKMPP